MVFLVYWKDGRELQHFAGVQLCFQVVANFQATIAEVGPPGHCPVILFLMVLESRDQDPVFKKKKPLDGRSYKSTLLYHMSHRHM